MKKQVLFLMGLLVVSTVFAQAPQTFSFQAVIRDTNNQVVSNQPVGMMTTILQGAEDGTIVYRELYHPNPATNINGLITLQVGNGITLIGNFESIDWSAGPYFIKTEADPMGGTNYTITGVTQLMSVPYALHAKTVDGVSFDFEEEDPVFMESPAAGILFEDIDNWDEAFSWGDHGEEGYLTEEAQTLADVAALNNFVNAQIKNLTDPTDPQDAATKAYVDLLASYVASLLERIENLENELFPPTVVTDIDGNVYQTVIIGNQEWMAENLRVTRYNNEDEILTGLSDISWSNTTSGAYAIYGNDDNMLEAYGKLYNWYAVDDTRGLCPEGWSVPSHDDWTQLEQYICNALGNSDCETDFPYDNTTTGWRGTNEGNTLKSCRQLDSPLEGCNTSEHPRWNSHSIHYGFDEFGFSALPGGIRTTIGWHFNVGNYGYWWSSSEDSSTSAWSRGMVSDDGTVRRYSSNNSAGFSVRCFRDISEEPNLYNLNLEVHPEGAGTVLGEGEYEEGELVNVTASANEGWEFVNWTGDIEHLDDADSPEAFVTMPADDVTLTAVFQDSDDPDSGTVTDIDNNVYQTVIIGNQEWMAENLRVTRYNNEDDIPTGLSNEEWEDTTEGAYAINPHSEITGLNSDADVLEAYGALYNWYAVDDERGLCPEGWSVPSHDDWTQLEQYICNALGNSFCESDFPYNNSTSGWRGTNEGNALKSCRQLGSPLEGCNTSEHPRWNSHSTHYGFDEFGFSALPGGARSTLGDYIEIGGHGACWSSSEDISADAWYRLMFSGSGNVYRNFNDKSAGFSVRCFRDISEEPNLYNLNLEVHPDGAGSVMGAGEYQGGTEVNISATANEGWEFVNWTGDNEHLDDSDSAEAVVTMPADNITLTAVFQVSDDPEPGTVTDIDNNVYQTVIIGDQEWMAENLRVTRYNNEDDIPTGLSNEEWEDTTEGAYAIYNNDDDMLEAYGKLYNWYAVDDARGLCPEGWSVPSDDDWTQLIDYVVAQEFPNELPNPNGAGNALKSCRQVDHPDGGDCDTSEHPRWHSHSTHYGLDAFGFSALPGGFRRTTGSSSSIGSEGHWWSSSELSSSDAWRRAMRWQNGNVIRNSSNLAFGFSIRCLRDSTEEPSLHNLILEVHPEGAGSVIGAGKYQGGTEVNISATAKEGWEFAYWTGDTQHLDDADSAEAVVTMPAENITLTAVFQESDDPEPGTVTDIDNNVYQTVIIGDQEWMAENLRVTRYNNEDDIPTGLSNEEWGSTTIGAYAIYDHNASNTDGINSPEEMVAAYGKLYNWYAVDDERGLCPEGWSVPSRDDWTALVNYVVSQGFPNSSVVNGAGNALKSCRQVGHPEGGDCDTSEHPRWNSHGTHSGFDEFGFSALPGGFRWTYGSFHDVGGGGHWWSATEGSGTSAWLRSILSYGGNVSLDHLNKSFGFSVRCFRDIDN